jgi:hypothetical protein
MALPEVATFVKGQPERKPRRRSTSALHLGAVPNVPGLMTHFVALPPEAKQNQAEE